MKSITHNGKWIDFNNFIELGVFYIFGWPAILYLKLIENGIINCKMMKIFGLILTLVLMSVWLCLFWWFWFPVVFGLLILQIICE